MDKFIKVKNESGVEYIINTSSIRLLTVESRTLVEKCGNIYYLTEEEFKRVSEELLSPNDRLLRILREMVELFRARLR